jgi:hypothetical protein
MLPESDYAKELYVELRDTRTRMREMVLRRVHGDLDEFHSYVLEKLAEEAEVPGLRELVDFAQAEDVMTPEMQEAAKNAIAWGVHLRVLIAAQARAGRAA